MVSPEPRLAENQRARKRRSKLFSGVRLNNKGSKTESQKVGQKQEAERKARRRNSLKEKRRKKEKRWKNEKQWKGDIVF